MNEVVFWSLISLLNWNAAGDDDAVVAPVVAALAERPVEEIYEFDNILAQKLFALDTKAHAKEIGEDSYRDGEYFSVDWFLYARCVVVANGIDVYDEVLKNPREFPKDLEFETLLYVASAAYEEKTGEDYEYVASVSYETYSNKGGWK